MKLEGAEWIKQTFTSNFTCSNYFINFLFQIFPSTKNWFLKIISPFSFLKLNNWGHTTAEDSSQDKNVPTQYIQEQLNPNNKRRIKCTRRQVILSEGVFFVFISLSQLLFIFEKKNPRLTERCFLSEFFCCGRAGLRVLIQTKRAILLAKYLVK